MAIVSYVIQVIVVSSAVKIVTTLGILSVK